MVTAAGGTPRPCKVGHAFFKEAMRAENAVYGGEMSAHHYFRDFSYCDTGMLPWLSVVAEMSRHRGDARRARRGAGRRLSVLGRDQLHRRRTRRASAPASPTTTRGRTRRSTNSTGLSMEFDDWRFNLRSSNTEPLLRLNLETRGDRALMERKTAEISELIRAA